MHHADSSAASTRSMICSPWSNSSISAVELNTQKFSTPKLPASFRLATAEQNHFSRR